MPFSPVTALQSEYSLFWREPEKEILPITNSKPVEKPHQERIMNGTVLYGPRDIRFEDRPEPKIEKPTDAIIRIAVTLRLRF